eukprot:224927-Pleurochrysis_carterae.AAC.1
MAVGEKTRSEGSACPHHLVPAHQRETMGNKGAGSARRRQETSQTAIFCRKDNADARVQEARGN